VSLSPFKLIPSTVCFGASKKKGEGRKEGRKEGRNALKYKKPQERYLSKCRCAFVAVNVVKKRTNQSIN
jgi:hypothetical protein